MREFHKRFQCLQVDFFDFVSLVLSLWANIIKYLIFLWQYVNNSLSRFKAIETMSSSPLIIRDLMLCLLLNNPLASNYQEASNYEESIYLLKIKAVALA